MHMENLIVSAYRALLLQRVYETEFQSYVL